MTFADMYSLFSTLQDKAASAYWPAEQFDEMANMAYNIWIRIQYKVFDVNEEAKYKLRNLTLPFSVANSSTVSFTGNIPDARYEVRCSATFDTNCGKTVKPYTRSCRPASNNAIDVMQQDPFNVGIDDDPSFIQTTTAGGVPILEVFSETTPISIQGLYLREPQIIDYTNNPTTVFELPNALAEEIVRMIAVDADTVIENYNRMQAQATWGQQTQNNG